MKISLIAAASENNVIGNRGGLPWKLPADLKHFRTVTDGSPVIMGRKTYESIGHPLPRRHNIVVSGQKDLKIPGCDTVPTLEAALVLAKQDGKKETFIIGGGQLYELALPLADRIYLTRVHATVEGDTYFPTLETSDWKTVSEERHEADDENEYAFTCIMYDRKS